MNCFTNDNSKLYSKIFQSFWAIYISFNISLSSASDWLICLNGSGISKAVTGHNIPDFWRGLGGTVAATLSLYAEKLNDKI